MLLFVKFYYLIEVQFMRHIRIRRRYALFRISLFPMKVEVSDCYVFIVSHLLIMTTEKKLNGIDLNNFTRAKHFVTAFIIFIYLMVTAVRVSVLNKMFVFYINVRFLRNQLTLRTLLIRRRHKAVTFNKVYVLVMI